MGCGYPIEAFGYDRRVGTSGQDRAEDVISSRERNLIFRWLIRDSSHLFRMTTASEDDRRVGAFGDDKKEV